MATLHTSRCESRDEQLIVDIDLSILGCPEAVYEDFERNVRKEYKWVPGFIYRKKRKEILNSFLDRDRIYVNDFFFEKFEQQARINIQKALFLL